jgi:hypothetical protein
MMLFILVIVAILISCIVEDSAKLNGNTALAGSAEAFRDGASILYSVYMVVTCLR